MGNLLLVTLAVGALAAAPLLALPGCGSEEAARKVISGAEFPEKTLETKPEGCTVEKFTIHSPSMDRDVKVAVTLPPDYAENADARYPVLYGLHGMGAPYATFAEMSPLRRFMVEHPMILVCFDADRDSCYVDATARPKSLFTTFFFDELLPYVAEHYRTGGQRAVTGFSMGGYGALHYMLTRPEAFVSVSGLSSAPYLFHPVRKGEHLSGTELLGSPEDSAEAYGRASVPGRIESCIDEGRKLPPILLTCGTEDHLQQRNRKFVDFLAAQNRGVLEDASEELGAIEDKKARRRRVAELRAERMIDFTYVEAPGGHNWPYWRDTSAEIAEFHWKHFQAAR